MKRLLPVLAVIGLVLAVAASFAAEKRPAPAAPIALPARAPFASYVGGAGVVEASSENVAVGAPAEGIVTRVAVRVGDRVRAGDPLVLLDDRVARAAAAVSAARAGRARAAVEEAAALEREAEGAVGRVDRLADRRAVSDEEIERRRSALAVARARTALARADLEAAQADVGARRAELDRLTVRAPLDGEILKVDVRPGELAGGPNARTLVRMGAVERLHVRVDVDENDAWRFRPGTRAVAFVRGNRELSAELAFVRVEPLVTPKTALTGDPTEKVDTRVLQVVYAFDPASLPAWVGQQLDVFIETPGAVAAAGRAP